MASDLRTWAPFREPDRFTREFDDLLNRFLGGRAGREPALALMPALESFADQGKLVVRADLPGVDPKNVEITVSGDQLTIRGKRERVHEEKEHNLIHREVSYGSFERSLRLPEGVKPEEIKAAYHHGVLELTIPVSDQPKTRKVPVQVETKS
jgi:HSP20 family protein